MPRKLRHKKEDADAVKAHVRDVYEGARGVIQEFVDDGSASKFLEIPMNVWFNLLSSVCALVLRLDDIKGQEKLQEAVVYEVVLCIIANDLPVDDGTRETVVGVYKKVAPTVIDYLIPGEHGCGCLPCC